ncbi:MAG: 50S ribosomal protein L9 [Acidobacteria bacterium]|nr:50S ribosomal protein L9 [Acidobacteriota bacterium]
MRVILLKDQRSLGKRGEEVKVKPGFGRNFLIPQGLALEANTANRAFFEQQRAKIDARHVKEREAAMEIAAQLAGTKVVISKRVGDSGTLYGSVTSMDVAAALEEKGITVDRRRIDLEGGIKTVGDHAVRVDLHPEVMGEVTVSVVAEE